MARRRILLGGRRTLPARGWLRRSVDLSAEMLDEARRAVPREVVAPRRGLPRLTMSEHVKEIAAQEKRFRQITPAVADGSVAPLAAQRYVKEHRA